MRILGLDFGLKRVGVALSDEGLRIAFASKIIPNDHNLILKIMEVINREDVSEIVIGESLDLSGKENKLNKEIKIFAEKIKKESNLPVLFEKEFLSSQEARRTKVAKSHRDKTEASTRFKKDKLGKVDHGAAAVILQRYLDKKVHKNI